MRSRFLLKWSDHLFLARPFFVIICASLSFFPFLHVFLTCICPFFFLQMTHHSLWAFCAYSIVESGYVSNTFAFKFALPVWFILFLLCFLCSSLSVLSNRCFSSFKAICSAKLFYAFIGVAKARIQASKWKETVGKLFSELKTSKLQLSKFLHFQKPPAQHKPPSSKHFDKKHRCGLFEQKAFCNEKPIEKRYQYEWETLSLRFFLLFMSLRLQARQNLKISTGLHLLLKASPFSFLTHHFEPKCLPVHAHFWEIRFCSGFTLGGFAWSDPLCLGICLFWDQAPKILRARQKFL